MMRRDLDLRTVAPAALAAGASGLFAAALVAPGVLLASATAANVLLLGGPMVAGVLALVARRRGRPGARSTWLVLAVACGLAVLGQAAWAVRELSAGAVVEFPSPSFWLFVAFHVAFSTALLLALRPARTAAGAMEIALDGLLVLLAGAALVLRFGLELPLTQGWITQAEAGAVLLGQVASVGSFFFALLLLAWGDTELASGSVVLLAAAASTFAAGNVLMAAGLDPRAGQSGDGFELSWLAGWLLLGGAGVAGTTHPAPASATTGRRSAARRLRQLIIPAAALFLAAAGIDAATRRWFRWESGVVLGLLGVVLAVRVGNALVAVEREALRRRRAQTAALEARLRALRAQLNPHFLFNALHSLSALLRRDAALAEDAIERLGGLLRYALDEGEQERVTLREEWRFVEDYLEIERLRLGPRLRVERHMEEDVLELLLPPFVLQPLVENAVRHGVGRAAGGGSVVVAARREGARLLLEVRDDGPGAPPGPLRGGSGGIGLAGVRAQLRTRYGSQARLEIENRPGVGFISRVLLPIEEE